MKPIIAKIITIHDGTQEPTPRRCILSYRMDENGKVGVLSIGKGADNKRREQYIREHGILDWASGNTVRPSDGKAFILSLPLEFKTGYTWAELTWEDGTPVPFKLRDGKRPGWPEPYIPEEESHG
ncbi:MAG: hypothetical protein V1809_05815 [Planctomycetota bacterium]